MCERCMYICVCEGLCDRMYERYVKECVHKYVNEKYVLYILDPEFIYTNTKFYFQRKIAVLRKHGFVVSIY